MYMQSTLRQSRRTTGWIQTGVRLRSQSTAGQPEVRILPFLPIDARPGHVTLAARHRHRQRAKDSVPSLHFRPHSAHASLISASSSSSSVPQPILPAPSIAPHHCTAPHHLHLGWHDYSQLTARLLSSPAHHPRPRARTPFARHSLLASSPPSRALHTPSHTSISCLVRINLVTSTGPHRQHQRYIHTDTQRHARRHREKRE